MSAPMRGRNSVIVHVNPFFLEARKCGGHRPLSGDAMFPRPHKCVFADLTRNRRRKTLKLAG